MGLRWSFGWLTIFYLSLRESFIGATTLKTTAQKWKDYASRMEQEALAWLDYKASQRKDEDDSFPEHDVSQELSTETVANVKPAPLKTSMKRRDIKILLIVRELIRRQARDAAQKRRAENIRQVDKSEYTLKPGTIEDYIYRVLSIANAPIHINWIIAHIEGLGWQSSTVYHKYAQVYKALRDNDYMFVKVSKATFKLREGFKTGTFKKLPSKSERLPFHDRPNPDSLPTITDLIVSTMQNYQETDGINPSRVHYILERMMGPHSPAYSTIYKAMQNEKFIRNGYLYKLRAEPNDLCEGTGKSASSL